MANAKHLVTGASGQLGARVLKALDGRLAREDTAVLVRKPEDRDRLAAEGYDARLGDYTDPAALKAAFDGIERLLLISSSEVGSRLPQHRNVIDAAKAAGVGFVAYTSILAADRSPMKLAAEHKATEEALSASGLAHTFLRNGWYSENLLASLPQDLETGQHFGAAAGGKLATAPRTDFAEAAAIVLTGAGHEGATYELAGDTGVTLSDFAGKLSALSGTPVAYIDMPQAAYAEALAGTGLPAPLAEVLADSDARAGEGWLMNSSGDLSRLIGRPTTPIDDTIKAALAG